MKLASTVRPTTRAAAKLDGRFENIVVFPSLKSRAALVLDPQTGYLLALFWPLISFTTFPLRPLLPRTFLRHLLAALLQRLFSTYRKYCRIRQRVRPAQIFEKSFCVFPRGRLAAQHPLQLRCRYLQLKFPLLQDFWTNYACYQVIAFNLHIDVL